jgi:hypothetical protein
LAIRRIVTALPPVAPDRPLGRSVDRPSPSSGQDGEPIHRPEDRRLKEMVRSHHERFDGRGYPDGLAGQDIPLAA